MTMEWEKARQTAEGILAAGVLEEAAISPLVEALRWLGSGNTILDGDLLDAAMIERLRAGDCPIHATSQGFRSCYAAIWMPDASRSPPTRALPCAPPRSSSSPSARLSIRTADPV